MKIVSRNANELKMIPCEINLSNFTLPKMKISCSVSSCSGEQLYSNLRQDDMNTFTLKISRRKYDNENESKVPDLHQIEKTKQDVMPSENYTKGDEKRFFFSPSFFLL